MKLLDNAKVIEAFNFRNACKAFDGSKKLDKADFDTILEAGRLSPSSFGFEPWKFLIVQSKDLRSKLHGAVWGGQDGLKNASEFIIFLARKNADLHPDADYITYIMRDVQGLNEEIQKIKRGFFESFQKDNFNIYNDEQKVFDWACKQCYIALGNMMSVAALLGLDSCPVEGFDQARVDKILEEEGIINTKKLGAAVMCSFGYRLNPPKHAKTRQSLDKIIQIV